MLIPFKEYCSKCGKVHEIFVRGICKRDFQSFHPSVDELRSRYDKLIQSNNNGK